MTSAAKSLVSYGRVAAVLVALAAPLLTGCPGSTDGPDSAGITVVAGTWSYSLTEGIPLPSPAGS
ncbi:MAG: hypothetical protein ACREN6_11505, partial [Gemmatimonadaceae bacterium]